MSCSPLLHGDSPSQTTSCWSLPSCAGSGCSWALEMVARVPLPRMRHLQLGIDTCDQQLAAMTQKRHIRTCVLAIGGRKPIGGLNGSCRRRDTRTRRVMDACLGGGPWCRSTRRGVWRKEWRPERADGCTLGDDIVQGTASLQSNEGIMLERGCR